MRLKRIVARRLWPLLVVGLGAALMTAAVLSAQPREPLETKQAFHLSAEQRQTRDRLEALKRRGAHAVPKLARTHAVAQMSTMPAFGTFGKWTFNGPDSITNGQALSAVGFCGTPNRVTVSGRVTSVAFGASPSTIYVGSASGGVWKTVDGGSTWTPLTDQQVSLAVGALAVVPGTPDTIYVGTGEGNESCDSEFGQGILKSTDGGASWLQLAAATFDRLTFTKIAVDPSNPAVLYAATTFGRSDGAASECRGVTTWTPGIYKSIDSGATWSRVASLPAGKAYDVAIDPSRDFTGPITGSLVYQFNGGFLPCNCAAASATVSSSVAKLTLEPNGSGGFDADATINLTQAPPSPFNCSFANCPAGCVDSVAGTYICSGSSDLSNLSMTCTDAAGDGLDLSGTFTNGAADNGTLNGGFTVSSSTNCAVLSANPALGGTPGNGSFSLNSARAVYAAIGGPTGGLFKSIDAGATWSQVSGVAPGARFAIGFSGDGDTMYVANTAIPAAGTTSSAFGAIYVLTDHGSSLSVGGSLPAVTAPGMSGCLDETQGDYDLALSVDPNNPNHVYLGLIGVYESADRAASFSFIGSGTHPDQHVLQATKAGALYAGNDGGLFLGASSGGGFNWTSLNKGLGTAQFQGIGLDSTGTMITGGTQDNGTDTTTGSLTWSHTDDGDGGYALIDQANATVLFDEHFELSLGRSKSSGILGSYSDISPPAATNDPIQFYAPFTADPSNPDRILLGTNRVWESCGVGVSVFCNATSRTAVPNWSAISGDLTGGCTTGLCDISDIAVAPTNPDVVYVVTSSNRQGASK